MALPSALAHLAFDVFASVLAPPRCASCDAPVTRLAVFCAPCASTVEPAPDRDRDHDHDHDHAAFVYGGAVAQAIVRMKYEERPDLARPLGDLLWRSLAPRSASLRGVLVVPVPLHPSRLAERGFNQSSLLARRLVRHLRGHFAPLALARGRDTPKQATLDRESRLANVAGAFRAREPARIHGRAVLLVDDVSTTGATLEACARALRGAGARMVATAVLARAGLFPAAELSSLSP
ncbi:MAG TPA: ComF family protein [Polyangiaceae bacterium]|jgi:ComF family protein